MNKLMFPQLRPIKEFLEDEQIKKIKRSMDTYDNYKTST